MARIRKPAGKEKFQAKEIVWQIALYIRLSKDDGNAESLSVTNQRKILLEYVEQFFQESYAIVDAYVDDGRTGTDYDRPGFQRMLQDVEGKKVNCIICKNLARAFRNYADQGYFLEKFFPLHRTRFITLGDPKVDTYLNPEALSGMEVPINGLMNDRFAYATSSSVRKTFDTKRRKGEFIGAFAPYGYAKSSQDKGILVVDEEAAQVVKDIFQWYVYGDGSSKGGLSKEGIARRLNERGILNPSGYKAKKGLRYKNPYGKENDGLWMGASISRILKNKVYIGTMVQGRQRVISYKVHTVISTPEEEWYQVEGTHAPIISAALFEKAQGLSAKDIRTAPAKKETYLFSGLLKCGDCGKSMTRRASKGFVYYNCSTYKRKSKTLCTKHTVRLDTLEAAVFDSVQAQIERLPSLEAVIANIKQASTMQGKPSRLALLLQAREKELQKAEDVLSDLYLDWKNGDMSHAQYCRLKERLERQEKQLNDAIEHIKAEIFSAEEGGLIEKPELDFFLTHGTIQTLTQGILIELIETIFIHEGGRITIQFKFQDPSKGGFFWEERAGKP